LAACDKMSKFVKKWQLGLASASVAWYIYFTPPEGPVCFPLAKMHGKLESDKTLLLSWIKDHVMLFAQHFF